MNITYYYVYHVYGKKIGCTNNPQRRIVEEQGYGKDEYGIMKVYRDIKKASECERNLQLLYNKLYGYKVDEHTYYELMKRKYPLLF